ncbi:DMT family transporter [Luethyella okanaganae]|uniref:DMT family transporter n=1 Tax=Luethyella okanaganae TaxID=69372 RepID=A0ABW1VD69_9MICO
MLPLLLASALWGTTGTAAHFLPSEVSPLATGAATMTVGGVLLFIVSVHDATQVLRDRVALRWLIPGALGVFAYPLAFYSSMHLAGVAVGTVVSLGSAPVFAAVIEYAVDRRAIGSRWAVSTALAVAGVVLLGLGGHGTGDGDAAPALGILLGLLAGFSYALYTYASERVIARGHEPHGVMGSLFGFGAVLLLPVLLATGQPLTQSSQSAAITLYLALGPMFVAYLLFGAGLRWVRSSTATTITLLEPLVATMLAVIVVGERLGPPGWIGLALVILGVVLLVLPRRSAEGAVDGLPTAPRL